MKFDRMSLETLAGMIVNKNAPLFNLTEAIKREAFFQQEIEQFSKRELYMMMDTAYRFNEMSEEAIRSIDAMMKNHGI